MEFRQSTLERLPEALNLVHKLKEGGARLDTITEALSRANLPDDTLQIVRTILKSGGNQDYKRPTGYKEQPTYPLHQHP